MDDHEWTWSEKFQDYYRWQLRNVPGKARYDLKWGRSLISRDEQSPSSVNTSLPPSTAEQSDNARNAIVPGTNNSTLPYQLSSVNFPSISEVQDQYQPPEFIQLDPTFRGNNSSPSFSYQRLARPLGSEDTLSTTGPGINTPTTSADTSRLSYSTPGSEQGTGRYDDDTVRTASPDQDMTSRLGTLSLTHETGFETIRNPRAYFKKGRVFKVSWPEPRGEMGPSTSLSAVSIRADTPTQLSLPQTHGALDSTSVLDGMSGGTTLHVKTRMFVVIRQRAQHCLCLPIYTYSQQGTSKAGVKPEDHAPLIKENTELILHPEEQGSKLQRPIVLILEDTTLQWSPLSRINISKVQSVEYNLKVKTVGRISPDCLSDLETMFRDAIGLSED
ncbi:hypothetical protein DPSP01_008545 [Paraphaeosphaeria sporulosa]|uniref:DUF6590 domain-containing protein n=1 Tax=Paraphaeosphaeria sporulosa TaxID=1460663 RepID=A0A177CQ97_9PLEO|nr:uncharacterized protein CC84DRAFT_1137555 [Paraphaeosphaeria sporulosa]OAG09693.1 hypothetical protein CC84DRAFT_1137555 [Paraphaeosphaeria sporulosa]